MILRILLLACAVVGTYSLGGMLSGLEFKQRFENLCFQNEETDIFRINGQDNPLPNTMENFISLAEKFEVLNQGLLLKEELFYFIRNYIFENIQLTTKGPGTWKPDRADFTDIDKLWEPDTAYKNRPIPYIDNFSDGEKCSLYHMISHSIVTKPKEVEAMRSMGFSNSSKSQFYRTDLNVEDYYPQEIGVVAIRGSEEAVSLSRVLVGLYVGLNPNRKKEVTSFQRLVDAGVPQEMYPTEKFADPLYTLTLAEVLMLSQWKMSNRRGLARDAHWKSFPPGTESFCPMVYKQTDSDQAYSYSTVRGAADGLILGTIVNSIESRKQNTRLSQLLRTYYSREGIVVEQGAQMDVQLPPRVSFCNRQEVIDPFTKNLEAQMEVYGFLVSDAFDFKGHFDAAKDLYYRMRDLIYRTDNKDLREYCSKALNSDASEDLSKETFLDVIVVMDTTVTDVSFHTQQLITGYLAKQLDLRYSGSRMTILLDQRINGNSASATIELKPVVSDEISSSCAACTVGQIIYEKSQVDRDQIVLAVDQLLAERKHNESKLNGANGKVVLFYNFESAGGPRDNNRIQDKLDAALRNFFTRHQDIRVYAVGLETESLKKFARNDPSSVILSAEGDEETVAKKLYEKISADPGLLQYSDCEDGRAEGSAVFENFVSPYAIQHWEMPAKYFYKSGSLKVVFERQTGSQIKVCHNRATMRPENEAKFCNTTTTSSNRIEFKFSNPCKSFSKETCSPFYFAVVGVNSNGDNSRPDDICTNMNDIWCNRLDSMKFKVYHEGIRCSGCLGLGAPPLVVLFTVLLSYILHKMF